MRQRACRLKIEILPGVVVTNVPHNLADPLHIIRQLSIRDLFTKEVTENTAEILMTRIGKKTPAIGKHPDKTAQKAHIRKCIDLTCHSILLIHEPPGRPKLNLASDRPVIEIADHS